MLIGAGIALISSLVTALAQHFLSLRADRIKKTTEKTEKEAEELRKHLMEGVGSEFRQLAKQLSDRDKVIRSVDEFQSFFQSLERLSELILEERRRDRDLENLIRELVETIRESNYKLHKEFECLIDTIDEKLKVTKKPVRKKRFIP